MQQQFDSIIIGGGVIGLSIAFYLSKEQKKILLLERATCGTAASWAAAGLLSPASDIEADDRDLISLSKQSVTMYPHFAEELGMEIGLRYDGVLFVGTDPSDRTHLEKRHEYHLASGVRSIPVEKKDLHNLEPALADDIDFGIYCPEDIQVDNRLLTAALIKKCREAGVEIHEEEEVREVEYEGGRARAVTTQQGSYNATNFIFTTGITKRDRDALLGTAENSAYKIYPVRGQIIELIPPHKDFLQKSVIIESSEYGRGYVMEKPGRILCGTTLEENEWTATPTQSAVEKIFSLCSLVIPAISRLDVKNIYAGLRPSSPDHKPIIGPSHIENIFIANGLYRYGVMLAPIVGTTMAAMITGTPYESRFNNFSPKRFTNKG